MAMEQDGEERPDEPTHERPPSSLGRLRRLWLPVLVGLVGTCSLLVVAGLWILANLDHRWVKSKVERVLSDLVGTNVSYEQLSLSPFSGLQLHGLVLATPEALRSHAPEMLRLEELLVPIELGSLFSGDVVIPEIRGGSVAVTVVITDDGRNSFGELVQSEEEPEQSSTPLSQSLDGLEHLSLSVGSIRLAPIRFRAVEVSAGAVTRQTDLESLGISSDGISIGRESRGSISLAPHGSDDVVLSVLEREQIGSTHAPPLRQAEVAPKVELRLESSRALALTASAELHEQSLFAELRPVRSLVRLESSVSFDPDDSRTNVHVEHLALLDSMLVATADAVLHDSSTARLDGHGELHAASLPWALPWLSIDDLTGRFEIQGLEIEPAGVSAGTATLQGQLASARYAEGPASLELHGAAVSGMISAPEDPALKAGKLAVEASVQKAVAKERGRFAATIGKLATTLELRGLGTEDSGMWGLQGTGSLDGSMDRASVKVKNVSAASKATVALDVDLANHRIAAKLPIESFTLARVGHDRITIRGAQIDLVAHEPLNWTTEAGAPAIELNASVDRVSVGKRHFRARKSSFEARRTEADRYAVAALLNADRVSWGKFNSEPESSLSFEAALDTKRPALDATAALSIAGDATTELSLSASHDSPITRYSLDLHGAEAGPLLGAILFGDGGLRSDELSFAFKSEGKFRGLVAKDRAGTPVLSKEPLRNTRGTHQSELRVERLVLVRAGITHQLRGLTVQARSAHEAPGYGSLKASASIEEARYGEVAEPVQLLDYEQQLQVAYAALHGAPSFSIETNGTLGQLDQPFVRQYPVRDVSFGASVDVDDTQVFAVRHAYWRNPAGGTSLEARGAYEGWQDAIRDTEVCTAGMAGCPEVASMYGREAATVTGTFEQDFGFWESTDSVKSSGSLVVPFTIESGDLNTYRIVATAQFRDVVLELPQYGFVVEDLDALIPMEQEFATAPKLFIVPSRTANAITQKRFFDLHPFTKRESFFTVDRVQLGQEVIGPVAANLQVVGSVIAMDQLNAAYRDGFVTGQFLADLNRKDPKVVFRGNLTGVKTTHGRGVLDANLAMTFVPTTLILEGKAQIVRVSKDHLYEIIDVLDPYHEDEDMNRVRLGLKFGYPKFVLLKFNDGLMDAKVDLGGLAGAIRIDEIKGIPVTPFMEQYVQPYIERISSPSLIYDVTPTETMSSEADGT